jgi:hypothetical protein
MSRYHLKHSTDSQFHAVEHWKQVALRSDRSVFLNEPIWTIENLDALDKYFIQALEWGEGARTSSGDSGLQSA